MPSGELTFRISVDGYDRTYVIFVPESREAAKPLAVVFFFHGNGGTIEADKAPEIGFVQNRDMMENAVVVFPQGIEYKPLGIGWHLSVDCGGYDLPFFDKMLARVEADYCIDRSRVFISGISWGADFSNALACCRGEIIRAQAPASGGWMELHPHCSASNPPAYRVTYGSADGYYSQSEMDLSIGFWRDAQRCARTTTPTTPSPCVAYDGCQEPVIECRYEGMGHMLPPEFGAATWSFFSSFR